VGSPNKQALNESNMEYGRHFKKKYNNRHFSAMVQAIATKFGRKTLELTLNLWTLMAHGNLDFRIYDGRRELLKIKKLKN